MKTFFLPIFLMILFLPLVSVSQENEQLRLPKTEEVARIEISNTGMVKWYKPEKLLRLLPKFVASEGTYLTKGAFQRGVFILKNGKKITWMAGYKDSILLLDGSKEQLYVLPKVVKKQDANWPLFPIWNAEGKEGYMNLAGQVVIQPRFEKAEYFSEGLAAVRINKKWGYINRAGEVVIQPRWQDNDGWVGAVEPFREGLASVTEYASWSVRDDSNYWIYKCGYIDKTGRYVIQPKGRQGCASFKNGIAEVVLHYDDPEYDNGKTPAIYFDTKGNQVAKPADTDCRARYHFSEGLGLGFSVKENRHDGYVNEKCEYVFKLAPEIITLEPNSAFSSGLALAYKKVEGKELYGYIDRQGKVAIPFQFFGAAPFSDGLAAVQKEEHEYSYINTKGETLFRTDSVGAASFYEGLAFQYLFTRTIGPQANFRNIYGYMNKQGKYVWLSPGAETCMSKEWIKANYVGPTAAVGSEQEQ
jgi:hypothetical protein